METGESSVHGLERWPRRSHRLRGRLGWTPGKVPDRITKRMRPERAEAKQRRREGRQSGLNGEAS